jgi:hypothetical protein
MVDCVEHGAPEGDWMRSMEWTRNAMLACIVAALAMARLSAIRMARAVNRRVPDDERISLKWWPNYKDRLALKQYRRAIPDGRLHLVYIGCMAAAFVFLAVGVALGAHSN